MRSEGTLIVRLATAADVPELSAVGSRVFRDAYGGTAPDDDITDHVEGYFSEPVVRAEISRSDVTYFMATEDDHCAGLVKLRDSDVPALVFADSAVEVQQLYVSVDFQRRGVGALLLDAVVAATRMRGIDGIWLSVWTDADWAMKFYIKYGFESRGEVTFSLASTDFVDHLMWLPVEQK